jgi:DNA-binding MarR family transcriptional regulator
MDTKQLQDLFGEFLQALGLHRPDQVPTGFSITLSELFALMALATMAPMSQQVLAEHLHLEKSTVSRLIRHLERRGWVKRMRDLHDTRMFRLHLSEEGHEAAVRLAKSLTERHELLLAELKPDEQEALAYGLSALIRVTSVHLSGCDPTWLMKGMTLWIDCDQVNELHAKLEAAGATIITPPYDGPFGWTFVFVDPDGYRLTANENPWDRFPLGGRPQRQ